MQMETQDRAQNPLTEAHLQGEEFWEKVPTVDDVSRIATLADHTLRNLQITQCYCELSQALTMMTGVTANWCTFATWASKQAGQTIRQEDLVRTFEHLLGRLPGASEAINKIIVAAAQYRSQRDTATIHAAVKEVLSPQAAFARASDAVGRGNKKGFEEIGREFTRFLAMFHTDLLFDAERIAHFCSELRPGEPPDGQCYLQQAFTRYYQARFTPEVKTTTELLLLANLEIGFHEQTRLQPEIAEALDAPIMDPAVVKRQLLDSIFPDPGFLLRLRWLIEHFRRRPTLLDQASAELADQVRQLARLVITECLMTLASPMGPPLRLGHDLLAPIPENLRQIINAELLALLAQIDPTPNSVRDSGADDWADFQERMHFITDFFCVYQEEHQLFDPPYTPAQVQVIKAGGRPEGRL
jgi:hypothetical protein